MAGTGEQRSGKGDIARFVAVLAGVFAAALVIGNWQVIVLLVAMLTAEHRPALLNDAEWDAPASAVSFNRRFPAGTPERDLTTWLEKNHFAVDAHGGSAGRQVNGLPCNETIKVDWSADAAGRLTRSRAVVSQIACL